MELARVPQRSETLGGQNRATLRSSLRLQSGGRRWLAMLILIGKNPEPIADRQAGPKPAIRRHALI